MPLHFNDLVISRQLSADYMLGFVCLSVVNICKQDIFKNLIYGAPCGLQAVRIGPTPFPDQRS